MKQLIFAFLVLSSNFLTGQEIPYSIEVFDGATTPANSHKLQDFHEVSDGVYLNHSQWVGGNDYIISFFDGAQNIELFRSSNQLAIVGSTERGAFVIETLPLGSFDRNLLFVNLQGVTDTLNDAPLSLSDTYQFGEVLYTFSFRTGIRSFTEDGTETLLASQFSNCNCSDGFYEFDDRLIFKTGDKFDITDGTPEGTRTLFENVGELLEYNGLLFVHERGSLYAYDPVSDEVTDVSNDLPNISDSFFNLEGATATDNGVVFIGRLLNTTGRELFITDGTKAGTQLLLELSPGVTDGVSRSNPDYVTIGKHLIFRRGPDEASQEIWTTDGSVEGTYKLLDLTDQELLQSGAFQGITLSDGQFLFTIHLNSASLHDSYIYSVSPDNLGAPAVVVDTLPFNLRSGARGLLNNRWVFSAGANNQSKSLISYGPATNDIDTISAISSSNTELRRFPDLFFYLFSDGSSGLDTLSVTQGAVSGFVPFLLTYDNSASNPEVFTIGDSIYAYVYTAELGESIYAIDTNDFSVSLVVDLFENNLGNNISVLTKIGNNIYQSGTTTSLISAANSTISPVSRDAGSFEPEEDRLIGKIGTKFFYSSERSFLANLSEVDTEANTYRSLDILSQDPAILYRSPLLLNDRIYTISDESLIGQQLNITSLLEINPLTEEVAVIFTDTVPGSSALRSRNLATDGQLLYFAILREGVIGPATYNPVTEVVSPVGPAQDNTRFVFKEIGDQIAVQYIPTVIGETSTTFWISPEGLGVELPIALSVGNEYLNLEDKILVTDFSLFLYSVDKLTGDSTVFINSENRSIRKTTIISEAEAVFFRKDESEQLWSLWRTDGTREGTRQVVEFPVEIDNPPVSIATFGYHVGVMTESPNILYLFDPVTEVLEKVNIELSFRPEKLVAINDGLYFVADNPIFGTEVHKIEITDQQAISGIVFQDDNGNGIKEEEESGIGNARIVVNGGNISSTFSNDEGVFSLPVKNGSAYTLTVEQPQCFQNLTTPEQYSIEFSQDSTYQLNFGYGSPAGDPQFSVLLNSATIRCGFDVSFWLTVTNSGCTPLAGEATISLPSEVTFLDAGHAPLSVDGNRITFLVETLAPSASQQIAIRLRMPDETFTGLPVSILTTADLAAEGQAVLTDTFSYSQILRCAIDPNDKQVSPSRSEPSNSNFTQIDEKLRYTIRFQNTGNDTAFTVRIMDKISPNLDLSTFKPLAASHPYTASLRDDRTAIFLFEDILLPDSTTNLTLSQGFVTFEVSPLPGITDFSVVHNTADIFFDFNQPIRTNTVSSSIVEFLDEDMDGFNFYEECDDTNRDINPDAIEIPNNGIDENCDNSDFPVSTVNALPGTLVLYPNPSQGEVRLEYSEVTKLNASVTNVTGSQVIHKQFRNGVKLDLRNSPPGFYFVTVTQVSTGKKSVHKVIIQ